MNVYNPVIPYCGPFQVPLSPHSMVRVRGSAHPTARCFAINLQCGPSVNPRDDIALHLSPVFSPPPRVVRNSLSAQHWGPEESYGGFPFIAGQAFELLILVEADHFKIAINGQHFTEFRHRIPINRVTYIAIDGDVSISLISVEGASTAGYSVPTAPPMMTSAPLGAPPYPAYAPPQSMSAPYPPGGAYPPAYAAGTASAYPSAGYPAAPPVYPGQTSAYPAYPHSPKSQHSSGPLGGLGGIGTALGGLAAGAAATSIGSKILGHGRHGGHYGPHVKHSSPIPIGGLAAGAGAAALGAALLTGHHPMKKMKKLYKHKGFKHKWHKPKFGKWKHKGWSSGSSSE